MWRVLIAVLALAGRLQRRHGLSPEAKTACVHKRIGLVDVPIARLLKHFLVFP